MLIGFSGVIYADFSRSADIVTDSNTGLQWQDDVDAKTVTKTWQGAIDYCEALSLGGHSDWRLPNINELMSLVDDSRNNPSIDDIFQNVASIFYWSSTTNVYNDSTAWIVHFSNSTQNSSGKLDSRYVRCVRTKTDTDNIPPEADAGADQTVLLGRAVTLNGTGTDSDGTIVKYEWKEGNTLLSNEATFTKNDFSKGKHTLTLTVFDDKGASASDTVVIDVRELSYGEG